MMKNKTTLLILLFMYFSSLEVKAQSEINVPTSKKRENISSDILNSQLKPDSALSTYNIHLATFRFHSQLNPNYDFMKNSPISLNYDMSQYYKFAERLYITAYNRQKVYLGLGNYKNIGVSLKWMPLQKLSIEGGNFLSLQYGYILFSRHITNGFDFNLNYNLSNKLQWSVYGQYMMEENKDPFLDINSVFPKNKMGTSLEYNSKENAQIGVGIEYQYNQQDQKWKPETKAKVSFGF